MFIFCWKICIIAKLLKIPATLNNVKKDLQIKLTYMYKPGPSNKPKWRRLLVT